MQPAAPQTDSLQRHFDSITTTYGDIYVVNLVNQKGYEKPVKEALERSLQELNNPSVHYTYFDFHHECKGLRFDRVSLLLDRMENELNQQGWASLLVYQPMTCQADITLSRCSYFYQDVTQSGGKPQRQQKSIVRTNCMDSLDRTNVVQSTMAKWALTQQLRQAGVLSEKETLDSHPDFIYLFRNGERS